MKAPPDGLACVDDPDFSPPPSASQLLMEWFRQGAVVENTYANRSKQAQTVLMMLDTGLLNAAALVKDFVAHPLVETFLDGTVTQRKRSFNAPARTATPERPDDEEYRLAQRWVDLGLSPWVTPRTAEHLVELRWTQLLRQWLGRADAPSAAQLDGMQLLVTACAYQHTDTLDVLLDHGLNPNATDETGRTVLFHVRTVEQAELLLSRGADPTVRDAQGRDAMQVWSQGFSIEHVANFRTLWTRHIKPPESVDERLRHLAANIPLTTKGRLQEALRTAGLRGKERGSDGTTLLSLVADKLWKELDNPKVSSYDLSKVCLPATLDLVLAKCPPTPGDPAVDRLALALMAWPGMGTYGARCLALTGPMTAERSQALHEQAKTLFAPREGDGRDRRMRARCMQVRLARASLRSLDDSTWHPWVEDGAQADWASQCLSQAVHRLKGETGVWSDTALLDEGAWRQWFTQDPWRIALRLLRSKEADADPNSTRTWGGLIKFHASGLQVNTPQHRLAQTLWDEGLAPTQATLQATRQIGQSGPKSWLTGLALTDRHKSTMPAMGFQPQFLEWLESHALAQALDQRLSGATTPAPRRGPRL